MSGQELRVVLAVLKCRLVAKWFQLCISFAEMDSELVNGALLVRLPVLVNLFSVIDQVPR